MTEWKEYKLSDIGTIVGGATPSTKDASNYDDGEIAWLTPKDLSSFTERYISRGERNITEKGFKSSSTQMLPANTVLFSSRAPIGYVAIAANEMCTNQGFKSIIPNSKVDYLFLYYLLKYKKNAIEGMGSGTTFKEVSGNVMKNIEVQIPTDINIQKKIADVLDKIDSKIENNTAINRNLSEQADALFNGWFIEKQPFDEIEIASWKEMTLEEVSTLSAGGDKPKNAVDKAQEGFKIPIYSNGISDEGLYGFTNKAKIEEESVTVSARGTIGYVCLRQTPFVPIVRLVTLVPKTFVMTAKYLYLWLKQLNIMGTGTTQQQLTVPDFKKTKILVPSIETILKFTELVNPLYDQILKNKIKNVKLSDVRDTLLPRLMSGELDISDLDI